MAELSAEERELAFTRLRELLAKKAAHEQYKIDAAVAGKELRERARVTYLAPAYTFTPEGDEKVFFEPGGYDTDGKTVIEIELPLGLSADFDRETNIFTVTIPEGIEPGVGWIKVD